ncbi:hypothetical protein F511_37106 [Dorcoceras hygrometricum]|uniref:Uncharacterized protein n=1 Tax=Dorcoceras hygrometricum TaxID=472368 RepID=A0A2Z7B5H5_9LAMI|nr:hypothetical protein F511_37106 [Dorcoceras hygrometricum]
MQTALAKAASRLEQPKLRTAGNSKLNSAQQCPMLELYVGPQTDYRLRIAFSIPRTDQAHRSHIQISSRTSAGLLHTLQIRLHLERQPSTIVTADLERLMANIIPVCSHIETLHELYHNAVRSSPDFVYQIMPELNTVSATLNHTKTSGEMLFFNSRLIIAILDLWRLIEYSLHTWIPGRMFPLLLL